MELKIDKPIRLIELFGGISCQAQALLNLGVEFENYRYCDFDKYACQSHNEIMGTNDKPSDITKWEGEDLGVCDTDKFCYIMTYSFPCTDLSTAGKMAGMEKGSGTRSGLLWEVERLLNECQELPQVLLMENVPQVHGKKNKESFDKWCEFLESIGYKNYWKDLNAKDYGVPQSRNRCFMVSVLGDYTYEFPKPIPLTKTLEDLLESEVDERYYLSDRALNGCINTNFHCNSLSAILPKDGITPTLCARDYKDPKLCQIAQITSKGFTEMTGRVYSSDGLCPTIQTMQGGNRQPKVAVETFVSKKYNEFIEENGYVPDKFNPYNKTEIKDIALTQSTCCGSTTSSATVLMKDNLKTKLCNELIKSGKVKENDIIRHSYTNNRLNNGDKNMGRIENHEGISPTLDTRCDCLGVVVNSKNKRLNKLVEKTELTNETLALDCFNQTSHKDIIHTIKTNIDSSNMTVVWNNLRIRKLTPKECLRLMGVKDEYSQRMTCSNAQKYKQAGNGIVVDVLMAIFKNMF